LSCVWLCIVYIYKYIRCYVKHTTFYFVKAQLVKKEFYSIDQFLSARHNDVDIWTFIFNLFYYCVCVYIYIYICDIFLCNLSCCYQFYVFCNLLIVLIACCNLSLFMTNSAFNLTCADGGYVNEYVCVCVCMYLCVCMYVCIFFKIWFYCLFHYICNTTSYT